MKFLECSVNFHGAKTQPVTRLPVRKKAKKKLGFFFPFAVSPRFLHFSSTTEPVPRLTKT